MTKTQAALDNFWPHAQTYTRELAQERMRAGNCPECGHRAEEHSADPRFWMPRGPAECSLLPRGVTERIATYHAETTAGRIAVDAADGTGELALPDRWTSFDDDMQSSYRAVLEFGVHSGHASRDADRRRAYRCKMLLALASDRVQ